jgi:2-hydroxy-3-oxopropionate reductase
MHTARELKVPLVGTAIVHELFSALLARGEGDLDDSAIITIIEGLAGIQARLNKMGKG